MPTPVDPFKNDPADWDAEYRDWVTTVREPAMRASEGVRRLRTKGSAAIAEYEIAGLPDGRHAVRFDLASACGSQGGVSSPWTAHATRDECVRAFLEAARRHFQAPEGGKPIEGAVRRARREMSELLKDGLFGFEEPPARKAASDPPPVGPLFAETGIAAERE